MNTLDCDVVIVGAGVAGGFLACNLRRSGLRTLVVDSNKQVPEINRGDQLAPCTVKMLDAVGALSNFEKRGSIRITRWKAIGPNGETVAMVPLAMTSDPPHNYILGLRHSLIHEALLETATDTGSVEVVRGLRVNGLVRNDRGQITGVTGTRNREDYQINARVVAGADGPRSTVREAAGINTDIHTYSFEYLMLTCTRSPEQPQDFNFEVWSREGFGGLFPIGENRVRCPVQAEHGEMSRWRDMGLDKVHAILSKRFPYYVDMEVLDEDFHTFKIYRHHVDSYARDGVLLLGDAAHCTPPYYGMGMNMGMRDGYYAAQAIRDALDNGETATETALSSYEQHCRVYNQFVVNASNTYGSVAAAKYQTMPEVRKALRTSPALDANVMGIIYANYEEPPPEHSDPVAVSDHWRGQSALELDATVVLEGLGFGEAPRWRGDRLWFADFHSKQVMTRTMDGSVDVVTTVPGTPGGLGFLPDGTPVVVSQEDFKLLTIGDNGALSEFADLSPYCRGCANDLLVDPLGRCYVGHHGFDFFGGAPLQTASLVLVTDDDRVQEVADDMTFPNGMALTPDGKTLIVAESFANRLTAFTVGADGTLSDRRVWAQLGKQWTPDGICLDSDGAVWAGNPLEGAFVRVREGGDITHRVRVEPKWAVACALGGPDGRTLFGFTAETTLDDMPQGISRGRLETVKVELPGTGLP